MLGIMCHIEKKAEKQHKANIWLVLCFLWIAMDFIFYLPRIVMVRYKSLLIFSWVVLDWFWLFLLLLQIVMLGCRLLFLSILGRFGLLYTIFDFFLGCCRLFWVIVACCRQFFDRFRSLWFVVDFFSIIVDRCRSS